MAQAVSHSQERIRLSVLATMAAVGYISLRVAHSSDKWPLSSSALSYNKDTWLEA